MPRSLPDLGAAGRAAGYLDVPSTSRYGCRAVAWPPVDDDRARFPGVVVAAFVRESWPCRTAPCLLYSTFKHTIESFGRPARLRDRQLRVLSPGTGLDPHRAWRAIGQPSAGVSEMSQDCRRLCGTVSDNLLTIPADAPTVSAHDRVRCGAWRPAPAQPTIRDRASRGLPPAPRWYSPGHGGPPSRRQTTRTCPGQPAARFDVTGPAGKPSLATRAGLLTPSCGRPSPAVCPGAPRTSALICTSAISARVALSMTRARISRPRSGVPRPAHCRAGR